MSLSCYTLNTLLPLPIMHKLNFSLVFQQTYRGAPWTLRYWAFEWMEPTHETALVRLHCAKTSSDGRGPIFLVLFFQPSNSNMASLAPRIPVDMRRAVQLQYLHSMFLLQLDVLPKQLAAKLSTTKAYVKYNDGISPWKALQFLSWQYLFIDFMTRMMV